MAWLTISGSQAPLRCWFERPHQPRSLVLVLPEVFGINSWLRDVASRLVAAGHGVLVVPLFSRTAPELDVGYDAAGLAEGRLHRDAVTAAGFQGDVDAVMAWLAQQSELAGLPVTSVGFCFGGHLAWHLATRPELQATVSFYGARVASFAPGGGAPTLELAGKIPGRLLVWLGADDPLMPADEQQAIRVALQALDPSGQRLQCRTAAAAGHGFMCSQRSDFHPEAAEQGWQSLLQLLDQVAGA